MGLIFMDGYDHYNNLLYKYSTVTGSPSFSTNPVRTGTQCIQFNSDVNITRITKELSTDYTTLVTGFAIRRSFATPAGRDSFFVFTSDGSLQCGLDFNNDGTLNVITIGDVLGNGRTVLGTTSDPVPQNTWTYVEFKCTVGDSAAYEVKFNGVSVLSSTGDTDRINSGKFNGYILGAAGSTTYIDDFYLLDTSGTINNDFLGGEYHSGVFYNSSILSNNKSASSRSLSACK